MDVLGHSLAEVVSATGMTLPAVKAALHRGRGRLREAPPDPPPTSLTPADRKRLQAYADLFNRRVFDGLRASLSKDRAQFYRELAVQFYGANRAGAQVSAGLLDQFWTRS